VEITTLKQIAGTAAKVQAVFRREGEYWTIAFAGEVCRLRDSAGLRHVAYLLARAGEPVPATELVARTVGITAEDGDPLDPRSAAERARLRVTRAIGRTLARIAAHHAALNEHLRATIKTGTSCAYLPDARLPLQWDL
jgi:hypothetical protein